MSIIHFALRAYLTIESEKVKTFHLRLLDNLFVRRLNEIVTVNLHISII